MPDIEDRFARKYKALGLVVVGVNPGGRGGMRGGPSTDDIGGVQRFTENLGVSYPVGVETTSNYQGYNRNFRGANPFPIDIIVDKQGIVRYKRVLKQGEPLISNEALLEEVKKIK